MLGGATRPAGIIGFQFLFKVGLHCYLVSTYVQSLKILFVYKRCIYKMQHSLDSFHNIYLDFVSEIKNRTLEEYIVHVLEKRFSK